MTRHHYIDIAKVLADAIENGHGVPQVARELADIFVADNPRFDYQRFYLACGLDEDGRFSTRW